MEWLEALLSSDFMPHGHCYFWKPGLVWLHVLSNALVGVSYVAISLMLVALTRRLRSIPFNLVYLAFGLFIVLCGITHFFDVVTVWEPLYWIDGLLRAATALASLVTAFYLFTLMPRIVELGHVFERERETSRGELERLLAERERLAERADEARRQAESRAEELQRVSEELRVALADLDALFEHAPVGMVLFDREIRYRRVNRALAAINGVPVEAHIGKRINEVLPELPAELESMYRHVVETGEPQENQRVTGRTPAEPASTRTWLVSYFPVLDRGGEVIGLGNSVIDITTETRLAEQLEVERRTLQTVTDNATQGLFIMDARQHCTFMNPAAERLTGFTLAEVQGKPLHDFVHHLRPDGSPYPIAECPIDRALPEKNQTQGEEVFVHKDGHFYEVAFTASPIHDGDALMGTVIEARDVTDEKRRERERLQATALFHSLVENLPELAWTAQPDGHIDFYNRRWYEYTGTTFEEMQGRGWEKVHDPQVLPAVVERWNHSIATGQLFEMEFPLRGADGTFRWFLTRVRPITDEQGRVLRWFGTNTDIDANNRAMRELERTVRFNELFIGILGHDLRNPLSAIATGAQHVLRRSTDEKVVKPTQRIISSADRMARMIDQILDLTRTRLGGGIELYAVPTDLRVIVRQVLDELETVYPDCAIDHRVDGDSTGTWDPDRLAQVASNLIGNAVQHGAPAERIEVRIVGREREVALVVHNRMPIAPDMVPLLFDPFRGTQHKREHSRGLGLGLYISQQIVARHGGTIEVESNEQAGTTFTVLLPRQQEVSGT